MILSTRFSSTLLLRSASPGGLYIWGAIGVFAGLYLFFQGFRLLQRRHLILDTPLSKIRSASMGMVELTGLAVGPYSMVAPITSRQCYYYRTIVSEWKQSGKNKRWVKVAAECRHVSFFLDDNTGKVMIDPRGADLDLHCDFKQEFCDSLFTIKEEVPPNVHAFLSRHGVSTNNKIKVEEFCIKPKNALFLLGTLDDNPGIELTPDPIDDNEFSFLGNGNSPLFQASAALREAASSLVTDGDGALSLTGGLQHDPAYDAIYNQALSTVSTRVVRLPPDSAPSKASEMSQQQKIAAALMKAGITNSAGWPAAAVVSSSVGLSGRSGSPSIPGADGTDREHSSAISSAAFDPCPPVVLMKGKNNPTFVISWRSQRDLARSLGWKCTLMIWGGPALALVSLYVLLNLAHLR